MFVNEGDLGGAALGHVAVESSLRAGMATVGGIEATFVRLPPMPRRLALLAAAIPRLHDLDLDFQVARWHAVQAVRTRRLVTEHMAGARLPDVLHVDSHSIAIGLGPGLLKRVPTILSVDATVGQWQDIRLGPSTRRWSRLVMAPSRAAERRLFERAAAVVALSGWTADAVRSSAPGARVEVIHPGIDVTTFAPRAPEARLGGPLRLVFVGGRFAEKGGDDLLDAVSAWLDAGRVVLDVVTRSHIACRSGVSIHRLDHGDPALVRLLQDADLLCLPSRIDAVPLVIPEAMACGTPALVSDVGAMAALGGTSAIVIRAGDPDAIRAALDPFVEAPDRLVALRAVARRDAEAWFDSRRSTVRLAALFHEVARAGARARP